MKKRVLATGVFDILHAGHVFYLQKAKDLGDTLVVLITSDAVALKQKRQPFFSAKERKTLIESLKMVDEVIIGSDILDYCGTIKMIKPDIIALGYDQQIDEKQLKEILSNCGWQGTIIRISKHPNHTYSTTNKAQIIAQKIIDRKD